MKKIITIFLLTVMLTLEAFSQRAEISGTITDQSNNSPYQNWTVNNGNSGESTKTDNRGSFKIKVQKDDILYFQDATGVLVGQPWKIDEADLASKKIVHTFNSIKSKNGGSAISSKSYWLGATLGYNLSGNSSEDVIGSAKVSINPLKNQKWKSDWGVIGNFANFQASQNKADLDKTVRKVVQSTQGLFLGIGGVKKLNPKDKDNDFRLQFTTGGRLNGFTKVGPDSSSVDLLQFRTSLGLEFEGLEFSNGGVLNLSVEGSYSVFDKHLFQKVFNESKGHLFSLEGTIILPIATNTGVMFNSAIAPDYKPVFTLGVIFKNITSSIKQDK